MRERKITKIILKCKKLFQFEDITQRIIVLFEGENLRKYIFKI